MSHVNSIHQSVPTVASLRNVKQKKLLVAGQGCITFVLEENTNAAEIVFQESKRQPYPQLIFSLSKAENGAVFSYQMTANSPVKKVKGKIKFPIPNDGYRAGIDKNKNCLYWVSIDSLNKKLRYGKGEMRNSTVLAECTYDRVDTIFTVNDKNHQEKLPFIKTLKRISASSGIKPLHVWKDPVVTEPPMAIQPTDDFVMEDAAKNKYATPTSLSAECQVLYGNVGGANFTLNTPDFPDFEQAIEYSMRTEGCYAYSIIKEKLDNSEFGDAEGGGPPAGYKEVYLRITLGQSQGNSPGIPYVLEIWPPGCCSPIHNHGSTHAVIRILRGHIDVDVYRMLPEEGNAPSLAKKRFKAGDVTYLMPQANQFHKLSNAIDSKLTCITIQCYSYGKADDEHHPTFDYIEGHEVGHFDPISDSDFLHFKKMVKRDWKKYLKNNRFWSDYEPKEQG